MQLFPCKTAPLQKKISGEKEMITLTLILTIFITLSVIVAELAVPTFLVFLVLKLVGAIAWSWFWVSFPLILGVVFLILWIVLKIWADLLD